MLIRILFVTLSLLVGSQTLARCAQTAGWLEKVIITPNTALVAKLDTGAKTSSLYAKNIKIIKGKKQTWVEFSLPNRSETVIMRRPFLGMSRIKLRPTETQQQTVSQRPNVSIEICFQHQRQTITVNLADRKNFNYPLLLGRQAIKQLQIAVDPNKTFTVRPKCSRAKNT